MNSPNIVFGTALAIIFMGYLLKSTGFIKEHEAKHVSKFLMHTTFPALVISTMTKVEMSGELFWLPTIAILFGITCSFLGFNLFKNDTSGNRTILTMGCSGFNLGLFAFPLIEGIWGWKGLAYAAMFDIGNSIINFMVTYGVGAFLAGGGKANISFWEVCKKILSLPPFQAMLIGLSINLFKIPIPQVGMEIVEIIAKGNKPLVLLLMGIYFSIRLPKRSLWDVFKVLSLRYTLGFIVGFAIYFLSPFDQHFRNMLLICIILPAGMTLITYSEQLNLNSNIAAALVNFSMLISFALMWILVYAFQMAPM
ncbi:AEC family transporter [Sandaracinomonas limnophila]|uniref:AEC family transporter n=1 Tax=Sandaracinomonas limnophila TaxID=1862386 RepID=A0A437PN64_9BACT|nr:AEC family transporter [Sandaracinomonas limnophila]RVU23504.1 AEC family transporter [Sandaracinomonas limnophila]